MIYALPENATVVDILTRSIVAHPSTLCEALEAQALEARHDARQARFAMVAKSALAMARHCERASEWVKRDDLPAQERACCIAAECGSLVVTIHHARKLQCLPRQIVDSALAEWDARHAEA